jgi:hypothetical protein
MSVPAGGSLDPVLVSSFGSDENEEMNGADLAEIGLDACGDPTTFEYHANGYLGYVPNAQTQTGRRASRVMTMDGDMPSVTLDLFRVAGTGNTSARIEMLRSQELIFEASQTLTFGIQGGLEQQGEIVIRNMGNVVTSLRIDMPYSSPYNITLDEGESYVIPPHVGNPTSFNWTVQNITGQIAAIPAWVTIAENYGWDLETIGTGPSPQFSTVLLRQGETDNLTFRILGLDPNPGSVLYASAHEAGLVSAVGDGPLPGRPDAPPVTNWRRVQIRSRRQRGSPSRSGSREMWPCRSTTSRAGKSSARSRRARRQASGPLTGTAVRTTRGWWRREPTSIGSR